MKIKLLPFLLFFVLLTNIFGQKQLPLPSDPSLSSMVMERAGPGTIYYGSIPANSSSKPVLVFVHGYNSDATTWWISNSMYTRAFNAGYRTAFVSLHPDQNMWTNGTMLNGMINTIRTYYSVPKITLVCHSKGGVDADAAQIHYGAFSKVQRSITLSSPHFGTQLADLAQSGWTWWLAAIFGQFNNATFSLQTGYMNYYRSITNTHPNNSLVNFRTYGAWGYSGSLWIPGVYLAANGGGSSTGGNDGVVPYYSTRRPGSVILFNGQPDSRGNLNHYEIAQGDKMWNFIIGQLPTGTNLDDIETRSEELFTEETYKSSSKYLMTNSGFYVPEDQNISFVFFSGNSTEKFQLTGSNVNSNIDNGQSIFLKKGEYKLSSNSYFTAQVNFEKATEAILYSAPLQEAYLPINLELRLDNSEWSNNTKATGTIFYLGDLQGNPNEKPSASRVFEITKNKNGKWLVKLRKGLPEGIYSLNLQIKDGLNGRNIVKSIAITPSKNKSISFEDMEVNVYPNPTTELINFEINLPNESEVVSEIFDLNGRRVFQRNHGVLPSSLVQQSLILPSEITSGIYFLQIRFNNKSQTVKFLIQK
jgi:pimeloyl-ACP methyl ester carboxylesterase